MIKKIMICGFNDVALLAAFVLKQQLKNVDVVLLQSELPSPPIFAESAGRSFYRFLEVIGIDVKTFMQKTDATPRIGMNLAGWNKQDIFISDTPCGEKIKAHPFYQVFVKVKSSCPDLRYSDYSLANKIHANDRLPNDFLTHPVIKSGVHYDLNKFSMLLYALVKGVGVTVINEVIKDIEISEKGMVRSIKTDNNQYMADFFIDCTEGLSIVGNKLNVPFDSFSDNLKINRSCFAVTKKTDKASATLLEATGDVVSKTIPMRSMAVTEVFYSSDITSNEDVRVMLEQKLGQQSLNVLYRQSSPGCRRELWKNNCLALGRAAVDLGDIHYSYFHIVQSMLLRFVDYFPAVEGLAFMSTEYNRLTLNEIARMYDYHLLFFWGLPDAHPLSLRSKSIKSEAFNRKIKLFIECGRNLSFDFDVIEPELWSDFLLLLGISPNNISPLLDNYQTKELIDEIHFLKTKLDNRVEKMSRLPEVMASFLAN